MAIYVSNMVEFLKQPFILCTCIVPHQGVVYFRFSVQSLQDQSLHLLKQSTIDYSLRSKNRSDFISVSQFKKPRKVLSWALYVAKGAMRRWQARKIKRKVQRNLLILIRQCEMVLSYLVTNPQIYIHIKNCIIHISKEVKQS